MMSKKLALLCAIALLPAAVTAASPKGKNAKPEGGALDVVKAEPAPKFGAKPEWAKSEEAPSVDLTRKDDPFQFLLSNSQEHLSNDRLENYVEYVLAPLNQAGLQAVGNVVIPWNAARTELTLHSVNIERDGKSIDALNKDDVSVIRRETQLEKSMLTGVRTLVMPVRGLQMGDKLRVSFTYATLPRNVGAVEEVQDMVVPMHVGRMVRRFLVDKEVPARWAIDPAVKPSLVSETGDRVERLFVSTAAIPQKSRKFVPNRFKHQLIQVSAFSDWADVADDIRPLFETARKTAQDSQVTALADKIAAEHKDPRERMLAALRLTQDQVRYVALLLGDGAYQPMTADEVWEKRFGDCKGKSALLLALLDRLGIEAVPVLASTKFDDMMGSRLPSLALFDHAYVQAKIGPEIYYLDGTQYGERTLDELKMGTTVHVLPLISDAKLVTIPDVMPTAPLIEADIVWDARNGVQGEVPFDVTLTFRGSAAAAVRVDAATTSDRDKLIEEYKGKVPAIPNDQLEYVSADPERPDGSYVVKFKGKAELDWRPVEGLKGNRFQLTQSPLSWDGEFDREDDAGKGIPVLMTFPYWERTVEKMLLPNGGRDFALDGTKIDRTVAATHFNRQITFADGVVTAVSDFRRLNRELDAESARAAKPVLEEINEDVAYIVSRKKLKPLVAGK